MFEYGDSPYALRARTRYEYVVRLVRPVSVKDVAVPAAISIWTKSVHADPAQRSIMIPDWLTVPLVHAKPMEARVSAVALRFVGASGAWPCTAIVAVAVSVNPSPSVTVRAAV